MYVQRFKSNLKCEKIYINFCIYSDKKKFSLNLKKKVLKIYLKKKNIKFKFGFIVQYLLSCLIDKSLNSTTRELILYF